LVKNLRGHCDNRKKAYTEENPSPKKQLRKTKLLDLVEVTNPRSEIFFRVGKLQKSAATLAAFKGTIITPPMDLLAPDLEREKDDDT